MVDLVYLSQNAKQIMRYLFEIAVTFGWAELAITLLDYSKMIVARMFNLPFVNFQ
jgi:hypothetical protein